MRISRARIEELIAEDVPYFDLTCEVLGIGGEPGEMEYFSREDCVVAGAEVVAQMAEVLGCSVGDAVPSGQLVAAGDVLMRVRGSSAALHQLWKVGLNTFDHLSAVATKTRAMVDAAHRGNPRCEILTTRKSMPGAKDLLTLATRAGGAYPHRLGLSETVLVFDQHLEFCGGFDRFVERLPELRSRCIEKKLFVEAGSERARVLAHAGVDGVQLDKVSVSEAARLVPELKAIDPHLTVIIAGGVNPSNAEAYAASGADGLATTAPFTARPIDMSARMRKL